MKRFCSLVVAACLFLGSAGSGFAHFGMVIPSSSSVMSNDNANVKLDLKFWHPFANQGMNLARPAAFDVYFEGKAQSLLDRLKEGKEQGKSVWEADYKLARPGLYAFVMQPEPYWEPEEDCFIVHYTKAYVDAFGDDEGWSEPLGIKAEIVPMVRPGALYAGNVFQGVVMFNGKAVPGAEVEVEWYPGAGLVGQAPSETMITQTVKADSNGVFTYAAPAAGWWGFAALMEGDSKIKLEGKEKNVEIGAVLWVYFNQFRAPEKLK